MPHDLSDDRLAKIEDELRLSRTQAWDVEEFLARRHQAKIEELRAPGNAGRRRWQVTTEIFWAAMTVVGWITTATLATHWLVTGQFPLQ